MRNLRLTTHFYAWLKPFVSSLRWFAYRVKRLCCRCLEIMGRGALFKNSLPPRLSYAMFLLELNFLEVSYYCQKAPVKLQVSRVPGQGSLWEGPWGSWEALSMAESGLGSCCPRHQRPSSDSEALTLLVPTSCFCNALLFQWNFLSLDSFHI